MSVTNFIISSPFIISPRKGISEKYRSMVNIIFGDRKLELGVSDSEVVKISLLVPGENDGISLFCQINTVPKL